MVIDPTVPGGQAGTSSMIRNYLGFPRGVSGSELTNRAVEQAWLFGAEFLLAEQVVGIETERAPASIHAVQWRDGRGAGRGASPPVSAGAGWGAVSGRRCSGPGCSTVRPAPRPPRCMASDVVVIGGGNSAGQAAVHLAKHAAQVRIVVRRDASHRHDVRLSHPGDRHHAEHHRAHRTAKSSMAADRVAWSGCRSEPRPGVADLPRAAVFVMIGAEPRTEWLPSAIQRDPHGYLLTGNDVTLDRLAAEPADDVRGDFGAGCVRGR